MKRTCCAFFVLFAASTLAVRADQTTATVQQTLKDQGFYYGAVTGQTNADTTAAIRRYQIRNGLQITGEIDAETLRSLGVGKGSATTPAPAPQTKVPATNPADDNTYDDSGNNNGQSAEIPSGNTGRSALPPPQQRSSNYYAPGPHALRPEISGVFDGTPYEIAPPDLQRHVIVGAQTLLARAGFYRSGIDGQFGPGTAAAIRAFQSRTGLPPNGRLNMETLGALGLLPGQHPPRLRARRPILRQPVYRGQWIPE